MPSPANPAPVSGPGALSRRTDGGPAQPVRDIPGLPYGEQQEMNAIQGSAAMFEQPSPPPMPTGLFADTERPDEPVTAGIASGPGEGPSPMLSFREQSDADVQALMTYMPALKRAASGRGAPESFKTFVRYLESFSG